jgi:hypothetical protein
MTQQDKELLFKDISARLPYRTMVKCITDYHHEFDEELSDIHIMNFYQFDVKPYLRPMSSMTDEEKDKLQLLHDIICDENYGDRYSPSAWSTINEWVDYCNSRHLDHYGLIEIGLALEAPEGMYSI